MYRNVIKRIIDFLASLFGLIILFPILLIISLIMFFLNDKEVFFTQLRPGKNEKVFKLIKFKTMNDRKDNNGELLPDHIRLSKIGKFLRKTSIDELPQLINVLKGDMSLVGPRPLLVQYLPLYNELQNRRHEVKPGITGWAQVNGRNAISWNQKFEFDVWYVDNQSFYMDIKILFMTVLKVFKREGISQSIEITMDIFRGNK